MKVFHVKVPEGCRFHDEIRVSMLCVKITFEILKITLEKSQKNPRKNFCRYICIFKSVLKFLEICTWSYFWRYSWSNGWRYTWKKNMKKFLKNRHWLCTKVERSVKHHINVLNFFVEDRTFAIYFTKVIPEVSMYAVATWSWNCELRHLQQESGQCS